MFFKLTLLLLAFATLAAAGPAKKYPPTGFPYTTPWTLNPQPWPTTTYNPLPLPTLPATEQCSPINTGLIRLSGYDNPVILVCDKKKAGALQTCIVQEQKLIPF